MTWKFDGGAIGWDQFAVKAYELFALIDRILPDSLRKYYQTVEPGKYAKWNRELQEADETGSLKGDYKMILDAMREYGTQVEADSKRLKIAITEAMIKKIHVLKNKNGIGDEAYREILKNEAGKLSSKELLLYEGMLVIRALEKRKA